MRVAFDDGTPGCIRFERERDIPDEGSFVLEAGTLESRSSMNPETCRIDTVLARLRNGTTDALLDDESRFSLRQERRVAFRSGFASLTRRLRSTPPDLPGTRIPAILPGRWPITNWS